jgi:hypothetical protein
MKAHNRSRRMFGGVALAAILALLPATSSVAQAQGAAQAQGHGNRGGFAVPITGTATGADGVAQAVAGTFTIQRFARAERTIYAVGTVVATVPGATPGSAARTVVTQVSLPLVMPASTTAGEGVAAAAAPGDVTALAACDILNLVLGPLDLNLLGLEIHLNQVVLDIVAQSGAGNLLGNLLCAVAGLLDGGGALGQIVNLLNSILAILG